VVDGVDLVGEDGAAPVDRVELGAGHRLAGSNRVIAAELFMAAKTAASVHVSNILGKLGAASRAKPPPPPTARA
jgi:Bacterial regulatory proteins, luxR family